MPSVSPSHASILSTPLNISSKNFQQLGSPIILVFQYQTGWRYSDSNPLTGASNTRGYEKSQFLFSSNISLCLGLMSFSRLSIRMTLSDLEWVYKIFIARSLCNSWASCLDLCQNTHFESLLLNTAYTLLHYCSNGGMADWRGIRAALGTSDLSPIPIYRRVTSGLLEFPSIKGICALVLSFVSGSLFL